MKTADEITESILFEVGRYIQHGDSIGLAEAVKAHIRPAQLEAMKEGMRRAAKVFQNNLIKSDCSSCNRFIELVKTEILIIEDQLTDKDLC